MVGNLLIGALGVLLVLIVVWAVKRAGRIAAESKAREAQALALMQAGGLPPGVARTENQGSQGETVFAGMPSQMVPGGRGIEVADVSEVVDIDELLRDEQAAAAERARALLEEPTNIDLNPDTFQPMRAGAAPARTSANPPANASIATAAGAAAAMAEVRARPPVARPKPAPARVAAVAAPSSGGLAVDTSPPVARPAAVKPAAPARPVPVAKPAARIDRPTSADGDVPLRELALAWFEARGYRSAPASPAVRPIELVLRHRDDPGRAYALVVEPERVSGDRVVKLVEQARAIGLVRLLVVADTGAEPDAATRKKGVRLMDRPTMNAELKKLDLSVAAKIIAVARKRATARAA